MRKTFLFLRVLLCCHPQIQAKLEKEGKEAEIKKLKEIEIECLKGRFRETEFKLRLKSGTRGRFSAGCTRRCS